MALFQHILFPVDLSSRCERIAPAVAALAHHFQSRLTLLYAFEAAPQMYAEGQAFAPFVDVTTMRGYAEEQLDKFSRKFFGGVTVTAEMMNGEPAHAILNKAQQDNVDLIMLPTRGLGRFRRMLLGSVAAKVLHDATCAVWTDSHAEELDHNIGFPYRNLMCAVNHDEHGMAVLRRGAELAKAFQADLKLVHAVQAPEMAGRPGFDDDAFRTFLLKIAREDMESLQKEAGTNFHMCIEGGAPEEVVSRIARRVGTDLVIIHRSGPGLVGRLRSHDYAIIRESPCPVLSI